MEDILEGNVVFREVPPGGMGTGPCEKAPSCPDGVRPISQLPALIARLSARAVFPVSVLLQRICPERRAITENLR